VRRQNVTQSAQYLQTNAAKKKNNAQWVACEPDSGVRSPGSSSALSLTSRPLFIAQPKCFDARATSVFVFAFVQGSFSEEDPA
jgi:hypothetical protein